MTKLTIGRDKDCDIFINDPTVSRKHATIIFDGSGGCTVTDTNSSNGTFVNGNKISGNYEMRENDILKVGNTIVPWRNYASHKAKSNGQLVQPNAGTTATQPSKKKKNTAVIVASSMLLVSLVALVLVFFYKSNKDELRMSGTWICETGCGTLTFQDAKDKQGSYNFLTPTSNVNGTWNINTDDKILTLKPGLADIQEVSYSYKFSKNKLVIYRLQNGARQGDDITLVKQR